MKILVTNYGGLGNILFQIAAAIYYKETYNIFDEILLNDNLEVLHFGTSRFSNRDKARKDANGNIISYKNTIFQKFKYVNYDELNISYEIIHNEYTDNKSSILNNNIMIQGLNQNYNLFKDVFHKLYDYFNLNDSEIINYIQNKYPILFNGKKNIMIGTRLCDDFAHNSKINSYSYSNAIDILTGDNIDNNYNLIVITDHIERCNNILKSHNKIIIDEDDIVQFYIGFMCDDFILSESTFHYWIALLKYIKNPESKIICFNDTDLTNRPLALPEWIKINY